MQKRLLELVLTPFQSSRATMAVILIIFPTLTWAAELKINDDAPDIKTKTHMGADFNLSSRKGQWTVLYFYPKADTPGCTQQACAFRDNVKKITSQGAEIYGISTDSVENQMAFHKKHSLNFTLLADPKGEIVKAYDAKMPMINMSKRWTFIVGPDLKIRSIDKDVDPASDADKVAAKLAALKLETK